MFIGYNVSSSRPFDDINIPVDKGNLIKLKDSIVDEIHIQNRVDEGNQKQGWTNGTILLAKFQGDMEGGNIAMRENPITKLRIKRRNVRKQEFKVLKEYPFNPDPTQLVFDDYFASADEAYDYVVTPVDEAGIEGVVTSTTITPDFEGWWLIDPDNPEENKFRFYYNLDDVTITTDEDRTELSSFSKYPKTYYGNKKAKRGTLSALLIPEGMNARKQYEKLEAIIDQHKPLLLKHGYGRNYIVNAYNSQETVRSRVKDLTKIQVNWVEVGEYSD